MRPVLALLRAHGTLVFLAGVLVYFAIAAPQGTFLTADNLKNIVTNSVTLCVISVGVTVVLITGDFDLSVGAIATFTDILAAYLAVTYGLVYLGFAAAVLAGALIGVGNALVVTKLKVNAFIGTLGMGLFVVDGFALMLTKNGPISTGFPGDFGGLGQATVAGLHMTVIVAVGVCVLAWFILQYTNIGRYIHAVGGNPVAAWLSGVSVDGAKMAAFAVSGACAGLAGVIIATTFLSGSTQVEGNLLLDSYTAVFLGAATFKQGRFNIPGTVVGVLTLAVLTNGMTLTGVQAYWEQVFEGALLIAAVAAGRARGPSA